MVQPANFTNPPMDMPPCTHCGCDNNLHYYDGNDDAVNYEPCHGCVICDGYDDELPERDPDEAYDRRREGW